MNNLSIFEYQSHQVRTTTVNNEPWFVAKDVCACLDIKNISDAVSKIPQNEKGIVSTDTLGGNQELLCVNEPGVYRLIFASRKPEAEAFKDWVFRLVSKEAIDGFIDPDPCSRVIHTNQGSSFFTLYRLKLIVH
jgi:prophage antirepressor-like protein